MHDTQINTIINGDCTQVLLRVPAGNVYFILAGS
jgi:hypothetical protein